MLGALAAATLVGWAFASVGLSEANIVLAYLVAVTGVATWLGRTPAVLASFGAVLFFNFFFTPPRFTLEVHDTGYVFTFAVMLLIALLVSTLTTRIRDQSAAAIQRERRTEQLYQFSRELSATTGHAPLARAAEERLGELFEAHVEVLLPDAHGRLSPAAGGGGRRLPQPSFLEIAEQVHSTGLPAGAGTDTCTELSTLFLPLSTSDGSAGVLAIACANHDSLLHPERRRMIGTCVAQVALALQRDSLTEQVHRTLTQAETERLRSALLSSVSHDLRTPLAAICGASSSLLHAHDRLERSEKDGLLLSIFEESNRLARLVDNLLHMTRIESGNLEPNREWNLVEDLVGSALTRMVRALDRHPVVTLIPAEIPLVRVDGVLIDLVLCNLIENAAKYSAPEAAVEVLARATQDRVEILVSDRGPGLTEEEKTHAFDKFYRGPARREDGTRGAGLGLAICAAIARLHEGGLRAEDRPGGGTTFLLSIPLEEQPPAIEESSGLAAHQEDST